jgi:hypothetical protein
MGQWNDIHSATAVTHMKLPSYHVVQARESKETADAEPADRYDQFRLKNIKFAIEPIRTIEHLFARRDAIPALGFLARKTPANGGHVDRGAELCLGKPARFFEPLKHRFPSRPRKGPPQNRFLVAWGLADQHQLANHRPTRNGRLLHARTTLARQQVFDVLGQKAFLLADAIRRKRTVHSEM